LAVRDAAWLSTWVHGPVAYLLAFVLGALFGSFANVCILRIPKKESIVRPGSHCTSCGAPVAWYDNLPIVSWLWLRGRCRRCGAGFSARYLLVEAMTGLLFLAEYHLCVAVLEPADVLPHRLARFAIYALFTVIMVILTFIDLDHKLVPDRITYPAIPVFFLFGALLGDQPLWQLALGVVLGYGVVRLISDVYYHTTGREGLGYGDGKLLAVVGGLLGWKAVLVTLFGGSLLGTLVAVPALAWRRRKGAPADPADPAGVAGVEGSLRHVELPFGPFLAAAAVAYLFLSHLVRLSFAGVT
jgi:leader peptidase (prepilin peptidase) / N-methyltransferase